MLLSREELGKASQLHPQVAEALAKLPEPPKEITDPVQGMRGFEADVEDAINARIGPTPSDMTEVYHEIPLRDGYLSSLKIQRLSKANPGALVVLCFAGGFVGGSNRQFADIGRALAQLAGATVISISYRLAPEHKFPAAQLDTIDSLRWIADNASSDVLNADPSKGFVMGGVSAGGNLTACLSRLFQKEPLAHPLTGQWLAAPSLMDHERVPDVYKAYFNSREDNAEAPILNAKGMANGRKLTESDYTSDLRYPFNSDTAVSGQPRTYFQCSGLDPFRDDSLIYEEVLNKAGVPTKIDFYPGLPHTSWTLSTGYEMSNKPIIDSVVGIGWLLGRELSRQEIARALVLELF